MENKLMIFENEAFGKVRTLNLNGEPWFVAADVCKALELGNPSMTVESLDEFYYNADFVISPIFEGSGMKTKTAEALMFGKTIFGTKEAFEGYSFDYGKVGCLCNNAEDFICAIDNYNLTKFRFNDYSRNMYLRNYSFNKLHEILTDYIVNH